MDRDEEKSKKVVGAGNPRGATMGVREGDRRRKRAREGVNYDLETDWGYGAKGSEQKGINVRNKNEWKFWAENLKFFRDH